MAKVVRHRLDEELVLQGFFPEREEAARAVMAGLVSSRGEKLEKPGQPVKEGAVLHVKGSSNKSMRGLGIYVGRGGLKLEGAIEDFGLVVDGLNCLDVGCSTGGFTDCLLRHGAARVCAVDVGHGQFDWALRCDSRVALFERTNICDAQTLDLGGPFDLAVADVSFTSVQTILPSVMDLLCPRGLFCTLVKPQFEAAREHVGEGGIVRDPSVHVEVLARVLEGLSASGMGVCALCISPIRGAKGNIEYFALAKMGEASASIDVSSVVERAWGLCKGC